MPANLPPEARAKWLKVTQARTKEEKLEALMEFLSAVPRHKGTEKLIKQVTQQISRLRRELEAEARRRREGGFSPFVEKEGAFQVVLIGLPNTGKTWIFNGLTGLACESGEDPFETKRPTPGMSYWNGVEVQLVDTPSLVAATSSPRNNLVMAMAFNADALGLVIDASQDWGWQLSMLEQMLGKRGIVFREADLKVRIEKRDKGGVTVVGPKGIEQEVIRLLKLFGIYHATVWLSDDANLKDVENAIISAKAYKPTVVFLTKKPEAMDAAVVQEKIGAVPVIEVPGKPDWGKIKEIAFSYFIQKLGLIRVYTRDPRTGGIGDRPLVLRRGARVIDVAERIHSSLVKGFKFALVWNDRRFKFSPQRVGREFQLEDGDVVEIIVK